MRAKGENKNLFGTLCAVLIIMWMVSHIVDLFDHTPSSAPAITSAQQELSDEQEYLKNEKPPYVWATIRLEDGTLKTGRVVFTPQCPAGRLCAEPDLTIRDETGDDWTVPDGEASDEQDGQ